MERRKEPRIDIDQEVTLTVLGGLESQSIQARAVEMSGRGMRILSSLRVPYEAAVKVQTSDLLLLGEVIRVQATGDGYMLALKLRHSVDLRGDLFRLNDAIRREDQGTERPVADEIATRERRLNR
jgi:hypothetical protein